MYTIENSTLISSTPARLLEALTTKDGIKGWWTNDVDCDAEKREATFRFDKNGGEVASTFRLDTADDGCVVMTCTAASHGWLHTTLVFRMQAQGNKTRVALVHAGYAAKDELYENCTKGWAYFLESLKQYAETGKGTPHVRASKAA